MSDEIYVMWMQTSAESGREIFGAFRDRGAVEKRLDEIFSASKTSLLNHMGENKKSVLNILVGVETKTLEGETDGA